MRQMEGFQKDQVVRESVFSRGYHLQVSVSCSVPGANEVTWTSVPIYTSVRVLLVSFFFEFPRVRMVSV